MGVGCSVFSRSPGQSMAQLPDDGRHCRCTATSPCDSGVAMMSRHSVGSVNPGEVEDEEENDDEQNVEVVILKELTREDGDGAVDDDQTPAERIDHVDSGRMVDTRHILTPRSSTPPTSPPPARSSSSPSGSTVEIRVEAKRRGSSSSSRGGSRPTSSKRRPPSVGEEQTAVREPTPVGGKERRDDTAAVSDDSAATAVETEDLAPPVHASVEAPVDSVGLKSENNPPTSSPPSTVEVVKAKRCGSSGGRSSRAGSRPTSSKHQSTTIVEVVTESTPVAAVVDEELRNNTVTISDDSAATATESNDSAPPVHAAQEEQVDRISLKALDNEEDHTTASDMTSNANAATADSTAEHLEQVQPEIASVEPITAESETDSKPEVSDQRNTQMPEQQPETEIPSFEVDCQVEPETLNRAEQPEVVVLTKEADNREEETVAELPETAVEQPNATSPTTESQSS